MRKAFLKIIGISLLASLLFLPFHAQASDLDAQLTETTESYFYSPKPTDLDKIKSLLSKGAKATLPSNGSCGALIIAIQYKDPELVDLFLNAKADVKTSVNGTTGLTPLLIALINIRDAKALDSEKRIIKSLIKAGSDLSAKATEGIFPLKIAATGGTSGYPQPEIVDLLLKAGADINEKTYHGETALTSIAAGDLTTLKMLLAAGADPDTETQKSYTPLHYVCKRPSDLKGKPEKDAAERIKLLMKSADSLNTPPKDDPMGVGVPLLEALKSNNPDCVRAMIDAGAKLNALAFSEDSQLSTNSRGWTVRQTAKKHMELIDPETAELLK